MLLCTVQVSYSSELLNMPKGFNNLGNTCYLNSTLQCLFATKSFRDTVLSYEPGEGDNSIDKNFTQALQSLIKQYSSTSESSIAPAELVNLVNTNIFNEVGRQQDAEEFFIKFIDHLYPKPALTNLFKIGYTYKKVFDRVEVDNREYGLFHLNIPFDYVPVEKREQGTAIETLIKSFFSVSKKATVEGTNPAGKMGSFIMSEENNFNQASEILVVTAPRVNEMLEKHMIPIWSLTHQFYLSKKDDSSTKYWYSLIGAVLHSGSSLKGGHYIAVSRYGNQWYLCNDSHIEPINEGRLGNILQGEPQGAFRQRFQSYLFFFERASRQAENPKPTETLRLTRPLRRYSPVEHRKPLISAKAVEPSAQYEPFSEVD